MSMHKTALALGQLLRSVHMTKRYLEVAPGQQKTHVNSYRRQTMHRGKVDPGSVSCPGAMSCPGIMWTGPKTFVNFITLIILRWFGQFITSRQLFFTINLIAFLSHIKFKVHRSSIMEFPDWVQVKEKTLHWSFAKLRSCFHIVADSFWRNFKFGNDFKRPLTTVWKSGITE